MKKFAMLIMLGFLLFSCGNSGEGNPDGVTSSTWDQGDELIPVAVEVLEVSKGQLVPFVEASGVIRGIREARVLSETQGKISSLSLSLGQPVREGQVLLTVENDLQRLNRDLARQQYESAQLDFDAMESSYKKGGISRSDYNSAMSRLLQSRTAYESAQKSYDSTFIKAPFSGSVALMDTDLTVGAVLSPGAQIALVADTSSMKMDISLGERQVNLIGKGQPALVEISSLNGSGPIEGKVEAIGTGSDDRTGSFPVQIVWVNRLDDSVRSGLTARVLMENTREAKRIIIPSSAIVIRDRKTSVILAEGGKSSIREIVTGESLGGHTVVESGLKEGDLLIVSALTSLGNNYAVETTLAGKTGEWQ